MDTTNNTVTPNVVGLPAAVNDGYMFTATQDWFSFNIEAWRKLFPHVSSLHPRALEIGSWEGRSAVFLLNELCGSSGSMTCIDHFDLFQTVAGRERHKKVLHNLKLTGRTSRVMCSFSVPALMTLLEEEIAVRVTEPGYDWIYIDGSHRADDTFLDAELVWRLARQGAVVIFDDYNWDKEPEDSIHHPKRGIDAFMLLHQNEFDVLSSPTQYQKILRKTTQMRIGFLVNGVEASNTHSSTAFGYDIHIALVVDSSFAMPAAVAISSAMKHTPGRMTFYILDLCLSVEDRNRLSQLVAERDEVTIVFLPMPNTHPLSAKEAVWAKLSVLEVVPVERVLYLDADILVRSNLRPLWETDLQGKPLGAVIDIGHPMGHAGVEHGEYFNAGVLLFDLAKARTMVPQLLTLADGMMNSEYKDQDVLNVQFRGQWFVLDPVWNAQGLGTYANSHSAERAALDLDNMRGSPVIVHFTGPVSPSVAQVLNPFVQPYTAKPWGYAGAPGHPFAEEWWNALEQTPWQGYRNSEEYAHHRTASRERVLEAAAGALKARTSF
ncbi:glycosyl transferase [Irpex rosettiformis]|uniref:Glycosyl transferase n=1 Tax=Irpex rosettiformis TaxID=378272 RepID=A0ACB8UE31_9APHY|nr:glycosyl transferase [Irpex rosettiformis]